MYLNMIIVITTKILHHNTHLLHYWLSLINLVVSSVHISSNDNIDDDSQNTTIL